MLPCGRRFEKAKRKQNKLAKRNKKYEKRKSKQAKTRGIIPLESHEVVRIIKESKKRKEVKQ